jgi:hypothetical protein
MGFSEGAQEACMEPSWAVVAKSPTNVGKWVGGLPRTWFDNLGTLLMLLFSHFNIWVVYHLDELPIRFSPLY